MSTERVGRARPIGALLLLSAAACAGTLTDPEQFEIDGSSSSPQGGGAGCGDVPTTIFQVRCALSGCHSARDMMGGLDLQSPDARTRLVGKMAMGGPGVLVDPGGDPTKSILYLKLTPSPPFGAQMPLTGPKLDDASLTCVAGWIATRPAPIDAGVTVDAGPSAADAPWHP